MKEGRKLSARRRKWIERTVKNNRSYKILLYNRFFAFLLSVLVQLVFWAGLIFSLLYNSRAAIILQALLFALEIVFVLHLLSQDTRLSTRISWILLILLLPAFGVPFYILNATGRSTRKMKKKLQQSKAENGAEWQSLYEKTGFSFDGERRNALSHQLYTLGGYKPYYGGEVRYYPSGELMFPQMVNALQKAEKYVLIEYFIIAHGKMWQELLQILLSKAEQGVKIRIIYDSFGCMMTLPPRYGRYLESLHENIKCMTFNPVVPFLTLRMNNRDHRKMLVIDGKTAFTGGINLADEYIGEKRRFGHWKDSGVEITGESVSAFVKMFFDVWNAFYPQKERLQDYCLNTESAREKTCERVIQPYDDSPLDKLPLGETAYAELFNRASKSLWICTPYLVLSDYMRSLLCAAALRGVDVRIITPGIPDKKLVYRLTRANYAALIGAGVKIYEYTPGFIHAKSVLCDGECAIVGTINLDYRSLCHHFENAVYFTDKAAVDGLKRDCEETFAVSKLCTKDYPRRTVLGRLFDCILRVFETLL